MRAVFADRTSIGARRPTLQALARAVCPPDGLTDEVLRGTVDDAVLLVEAMAGPARAALVAAAGLLELVPVRRPGRRRFSALGPDDARAVLDTMAGAGSGAWRLVSLLRDVVVFSYFEQPAVRRAVGYEPDPWIAARAAERASRWAPDIEAHRRLLVAPAPLRDEPGRRPPRPTGAFRAGSELPTGGVDCDVVVVGSGAGGAVVAAELAEAGLDVVVLEEGGHHPTGTFTSSTSQMVRTLYRDAGVSTTLGRVAIGYSEGRCVGGSTVVNGAMAFRAPEHVLARWAVGTGVSALARDGLDAEYRRVERFVSATGQDPGSIGRDQSLLKAGADRLGWRVVDNVRAQVHCAGCNVCTWGCPTGAKQSTLVSYLPRAVAFGATVWSDCRVDRVVLRGKRAVGVAGRTSRPDGTVRPFVVRARRVVLACGATQTPCLLQRSGVRPPSGQLGRNLAVHPGAQVAAVFDEVVDGWKGAHQTYQIREFERDGILMAAVNLPPSLVARSLPENGTDLGDVMSRYDRIVTAGVLVEDTGSGRVRAVGRDGTLVTYRLHDRDAEQVVKATLLLCEALLAAGATSIHLPFARTAPVRHPDDLRAIAAVPVAPSALVLSTVHLMGTARFGADPVHAVCDPWGAVHDAEGLHVADASLLPGPVGVNPMLTIMALATRVAAGVLDRSSHR